VEFAKYVQSKHPEKPTFIFAHSCGTLVVILAVPDIKNVQAVVLSGAPLFVGPDSASPFGLTCLYPLSKTSFARSLTSCMSGLDPQGPVAPIFVRGITSDAEEVKIHGNDKRMFHHWIMNKTAFEVLKMTEEVKSQGLAQFSSPVLIVHGGNDSVALPVSSEYVYANIKTEPEKKSIKIFDGLRHEVLHEKLPQRSECAALYINYFEEQLVLLTKS
jgi:alpha-beta hydrolase superfamily lysophospholipase